MNPLETEIGGLRMKNPLMLASGIMGSKVHSLNLIARDAGAVVTKSVGVEEREGYRNPTVVNWKCGLINAVGLASPAAKDFAEELKDYTNEAPLLISLYGHSVEEFSDLVDTFDSALPYLHGYELNLSCPHVKGAGLDIGMDLELSAAIVEELKGKTKNPVFAKLSAMHDYLKLAKVLEDAGVDGITISNTLRGMKIDIMSGKPVLSNLSGGVSGPAIKPIALKCVYDLYKEIEVPIVGCGGITSFEDVLEFIMAGARAVQIGSAVYYSRRIFYSLKESLIAFTRARDCTISDLIGIAHS
ncbi:MULTISPECIES: dihydroorotate dehydrogenase [Archaeoglobus]|jgi:dihydroorotate dehydrogenase (NAD+) catalytic subunit|uniref:Dihydroorotate dehydrogenase B (NAD(+)), catalytic subunit n=3 Tax=Archaeoglobus fulgidus TaxID=2234 RepID=PYRDB_ARCFU|nr:MULTISPECIES: dihydroorotate dehydrogenase [Archaeoglobus]O29513.1 RecName: Full=Dihydroorotate dehydrogenase B (NAD(+)), catalytic subunit; Short=DHOD B; Short=DHODase B; Short=DHOdehase B; AltName: Full=Dihydroorotate oxidase B; AltName: Full=Orotate reductase (NADH) [Archaeoglobus fulgidus DSM 4304]AAB90494.1 dihydroorotase dehydrogenase (pyrD) [Archaeoglobus fulgidus DSM 4304]AIG97621.1 dihydroorotate dehydrogenase (subfamily 1) family protein [Archaeoglobus fulgidus DSM 8774]KUJ93516.1 